MGLPNIDMLSAIDALWARYRHGAMHRFTFVPNAPLSPIEVERLLRRYGVRVWGRKIVGDNRSFMVKEGQAQWAEYLMCRAGVALLTPLFDKRNECQQSHAEKPMPKPWTAKGIGAISLIDHIGEFFSTKG